jgi:hypothetical protein
MHSESLECTQMHSKAILGSIQSYLKSFKSIQMYPNLNAFKLEWI